jgi:hypothetical protein
MNVNIYFWFCSGVIYAKEISRKYMYSCICVVHPTCFYIDNFNYSKMYNACSNVQEMPFY